MKFGSCYLLFTVLISVTQENEWCSSTSTEQKSLLRKLSLLEGGDKISTALWHAEARDLLLELKTSGVKARASCEKLVTGIARDTGRNPTNKGVAICDTIVTLGAMTTDLLGQMIPKSLLGNVAKIEDPSEPLLNVIVVFVFRNDGQDCLERLLCEANKHAASRSSFDTFVAYVGNIATALFATDVPLSKSFDAIKFGKQSRSCLELYPRCPIMV